MLALQRKRDTPRVKVHDDGMAWQIEFHPAFDHEFHALREPVQDELLALTDQLAGSGPSLGRPQVDTLSGTRHRKMKELRFRVQREVWRAAFAFDPTRLAIVLAAGNKRGRSERRFYERLIRTADDRYDEHLELMDTTRSP